MVQIALGTIYAGRSPQIAAPENTVAPVITGSDVIGSTLTVTPGTWTGTPTPTLTYQWQVNGSDAVGETASTFDTTGYVDGDEATCVEAGINIYGSDTATSNTITLTDAADVTPPTLSSPTDAADGATASTGSVSTDEGNGTLYWVVSTASTAPSAAQVKAGQMHTGAAAADSGSQPVSGTGVQTLSPAPNGLTAATAYFTHFMHEDAATNQSTVASADGFTTDAVNVTSFVAFANGGATNTVTFPTHLAPTGTQKDLAIGILVAGNTPTPPSVPAGVGWTDLGATPGTSLHNTALRVVAKYCATDSETFGTNDAGTPRCMVAIWRLTVAPADLADCFTGIAFDTQNNVAANTWVALTPSTASWILAAMAAQANQATVQRDDITATGVTGAHGNRMMYGHSVTGGETTWEQQAPAVSATDTAAVALGIIP